MGNDYHFLYCFVKKNPEEHHKNKFKLFGGLKTAYVVPRIFRVCVCTTILSEDTRAAIFISPIWFIFLFIFYRKYKSNAEDLAERTRSQDVIQLIINHQIN